MQLSEHDLKQLDEETIRSLQAEKLRTLSLKLLADLKEARDRLNQSPDNSSRPPSSRAPWEGADTEPQDDGRGRRRRTARGRARRRGRGANERSVNRAGRQKGLGAGTDKAHEKESGQAGKAQGAPGYGRTVELAVTAERTHRPHECALCAQSLPPDAPQQAYTGRYEIDITPPSSGAPGLELTHTLHRYVECQCGCGHWTRAEPGRCAGRRGLDGGADRVAPGRPRSGEPDLRPEPAPAPVRAHASGSSCTTGSKWTLCTATINQCIHEAGRAVEPVVTERDRGGGTPGGTGVRRRDRLERARDALMAVGVHLRHGEPVRGGPAYPGGGCARARRAVRPLADE